VTRVYELIAELGSLVEHLSPEEALSAHAALKPLARFAYFTSHAKKARLAGRIQVAAACEREAERRYHELPEAARW
jgi:hypothetical protein